MTKDEQPTDENQSSLEDFFSESEEVVEATEDPPSEVSTKSLNKQNKPQKQRGNPGDDSGEDDEEEEDSSLDVSLADSETPANLSPSFLLSIDYSGPHNKAMARLYNSNDKKVYFWFDNTGHKPYCYTDWPKQVVESSVNRKKGFLRAETVELHDLLKDQPVKMTKVIGDNPLAIGGSPDSIREVLVENISDPLDPNKKIKSSHAWEAAIRYQLCYTYDRKLVPGSPKIQNEKLI